MKQLHRVIVIAAALGVLTGPAEGAERFPPPDFEGGHQLPTTTTPLPRATALEYVDVAVLAGALALAAYLALRRRSRRGLFILTLFSLAYFGFWRRGCICSVGSVQNVALALFEPGYVLPASVLAFFVLPLAFALAFGRVFCAGVCPLGAIQDVVLVRPIQLPAWLEHALGLAPYAYLGLAVLLAATDVMFPICQYDPFVAFFRRSGEETLLVLGASFLVISLFVGRPYCRFLCPYGVLLRLASLVSWRRVTITPAECIRCRLCEQACPFGAIRAATGPAPRAPGRGDKVRLGLLLAAVPAALVLGGWLVSRLGGPLTRTEMVNLAAEEAVRAGRQSARITSGTAQPGDKQPVQTGDAGAVLRSRLQGGMWVLGGFVGLVIMGKLISLSVYRSRPDYEAERGHCMACGRCYATCPIELKRRSDRRRADPERGTRVP